jgi:hypothetical protein
VSDFGCIVSLPANVNKFVLFEICADVCGFITLRLILFCIIILRYLGRI